MKNILKNKIFIILAFFIFLIASTTINSFASSMVSYTSLNGITKEFPSFDNLLEEDYPFAVLYKTPNDKYRFIVTSSDKLTMNSFDGSSGSIDYGSYKRYELDNGVWEFNAFGNLRPDEYQSMSFADLYYSNVDITYNGELVFPVAPQEEETQVEQTMIATQITSVDFSQVITELLVVLPILLVVLIGLLALRKAIQLLLQTLHRS